MLLTPQCSDEYTYATSVKGSLAIMKAMNEILFWEKMNGLMPLVAEELVKAGVDFSKIQLEEECYENKTDATFGTRR